MVFLSNHMTHNASMFKLKVMMPFLLLWSALHIFWHNVDAFVERLCQLVEFFTLSRSPSQHHTEWKCDLCLRISFYIGSTSLDLGNSLAVFFESSQQDWYNYAELSIRKSYTSLKFQTSTDILRCLGWCCFRLSSPYYG